MNDPRGYVAAVKAAGPCRVIINSDGDAVPSGRQPTNINIDFILVRKDGWSIGGPKRLYEAARDLWAGDWLAVIYRPAASTELIVWFPAACQASAS